jgi:hypothetical protein
LGTISQKKLRGITGKYFGSISGKNLRGITGKYLYDILRKILEII